MVWNGIEVSKLPDEALKAAYISLAEMDNFRYGKVNTEKFKKKMLNQPEPQINPNFINLQNEVLEELNKRKLEF